MNKETVVNYFTYPSFQYYSGKPNVLKVEDNKCYINSTGVFWSNFQLPQPGKYRILVESQNIRNFAVSRNSGSQIIWLDGINNPELNIITKEFTTTENVFAFNIWGNDDGTAYISKIMIIDADKWDELQSIMGSSTPYFDYRTMPISIN